MVRISKIGRDYSTTSSRSANNIPGKGQVDFLIDMTIIPYWIPSRSIAYRYVNWKDWLNRLNRLNTSFFTADNRVLHLNYLAWTERKAMQEQLIGWKNYKNKKIGTCYAYACFYIILCIFVNCNCNLIAFSTDKWLADEIPEHSTWEPGRHLKIIFIECMYCIVWQNMPKYFSIFLNGSSYEQLLFCNNRYSKCKQSDSKNI